MAHNRLGCVTFRDSAFGGRADNCDEAAQQWDDSVSFFGGAIARLLPMRMVSWLHALLRRIMLGQNLPCFSTSRFRSTSLAKRALLVVPGDWAHQTTIGHRQTPGITGEFPTGSKSREKQGKNGGGCSLSRTSLCLKFPEIREFTGNFGAFARY